MSVDEYQSYTELNQRLVAEGYRQLSLPLVDAEIVNDYPDCCHCGGINTWGIGYYYGRKGDVDYSYIAVQVCRDCGHALEF